MRKPLLITRPRHDEATSYLFHWSSKIIEEAKRKLVPVFDLLDGKAVANNLRSYLTKRNPRLVVLNGHGSAYSICGFEDETLVEHPCFNVDVFKNKIIYALSCSVGAVLGVTLVKSGATSFVGYTRPYSFLNDPDYSHKPLQDPIAKLFLEPSNLFTTTLIKGNTVTEAYNRSRKVMIENLKKCLSSNATLDEKNAAPTMHSNILAFVLHGQTDAVL